MSTVIPTTLYGKNLYNGPPVINQVRSVDTRYDSSTVWNKLINPSHQAGRHMLIILFKILAGIFTLVIFILGIVSIVLADNNGDVDPLHIGVLICTLLFGSFNCILVWLTLTSLIQDEIPDNPTVDDLNYEYQFRKSFGGNVIVQLIMITYLSLVISDYNASALVLTVFANGVYMWSNGAFLQDVIYYKQERGDLYNIHWKHISLYILFFILTVVSLLMCGLVLSDWIQ